MSTLPTSDPVTDDDGSDPVRTFITNSMSPILESLLDNDHRPSITLKRKPLTGQRGQTFHITQSDTIEENDGKCEETGPALTATATTTTTDRPAELHTTYSWPGKTAYEAWKFSACLRVISLIYGAVVDDSIITKRDIYYNDPILFGSQRVVDKLVDDIAYTIGVGRAALHVVSVAKGLTAGYYRLTTKTCTVLDLSVSLEDVLIPRLEDITSIDISEVEWVLVVEKEAILRKLVTTRYHINSAAGKGILITGKGYPDLSTRAFVHLLHETALKNQKRDASLPSRSNTVHFPRFYALVDSDPDGMAIMSTYKYGSMAHAHESAQLNAPGLQWLGIRISNIVINSDLQGDDALIPLTVRDRKKARAMLMNNPAFAEDGPEIEWRAELQTMVMLGLKAETEILYEKEGGLEGWIDRKMKLENAGQ